MLVYLYLTTRHIIYPNVHFFHFASFVRFNIHLLQKNFIF